MTDNSVSKKYYSIGEVSKLLNLKAHVIRYWESEFSNLRPHKNRSGKRMYREADIAILEEIRDLLHGQKFTIAGAKKYFRTRASEEKKNPDNADKGANFGDLQSGKIDISVLENVKKGLNSVLQVLQEMK